MNIYLIRHSKAEPASPLIKDYEREITGAGNELIKSSAKRWKNRITHFDYLLTSPYIRAVQTADIISTVVETKNTIIKDKSISPGCRTDSIIQIAESFEADEIAFVGHQPDMSFILSRFISNYEVNIKFPPASIAKIYFKGKPGLGKGILEFLLPPS